MKRQTELRTYPPLSNSTSWGAGSRNTKNDNGRQTGQKPSRCSFASWGGRIAAILATCLVVLAAAPTALAKNGRKAPKVSPALQQLLNTASPSKVVDVIVQYKGKPQQKDLAKVAGKGGKSKRHLGIIQGEAYTIPLSAVSDLASDAGVAHISLDHKIRKRANFDTAREAINTDIAQSYGYDGTGVGIAIVDSGVYAHPDLNLFGTNNQRVVYSESFVPGDASPSDGYGHGTHVAGLAAGDAQSSQSNYQFQYTGVAPNANIINLRVLDANGSAADSDVIAAIDRAIQLQSQYNIRVLNLSLGRPIFESYTADPLC